MLSAAFERLDDGRASGGLRGMNLRQLTVDESNLFELTKSTGYARQQRPTRNRRDEMVGISPSQLLHDLEPHRLGAFGVVRAQVDVHEAPAVTIGNLSAEPVHVVVVPGNGEDRRSKDRGAEQLPCFEIVGNEHAALEAKPRRVSGHAVGEVSGRRTGEHFEAEFHGARGRDRDDAILVRERRMVDRVVLDVELADAKPLRQARAAHERRIAGVEPGARLSRNRQQLAISPEILGPALDFFPREPDCRVVVDRLERPEAPIAHIGGLGGKHGFADMTLQSDERAHTASASLLSVNPSRCFGSLSTGAGTMAARSRAMAIRSPIAATAVASPPAPVPVSVTWPANCPVMTAAFSGPVVLAKSVSFVTNVGATHAISEDFSGS